MSRAALLAFACVAGALAGCQSSGGHSGASAPPAALAFPADFRFGAATSAHQVEGGQTNNWTLWETLPQFAGRTAEPSGAAVDEYHRYAEDFDWIRWMGLDTYRFSIEWSRIEPERGRYDPVEIAHYRAVLDALRARGIHPSVTLHHFTDPTWFTDMTKIRSLPANDDFCADGPSDADFCYWTNPEAPAVFGAFCGLMAREFGDRVDEWWTFNELTGHWLNTAFTGDFPPGLAARNAAEIQTVSLPVLRGMLAAHAACYEAIHAEDTVDADGDGRAARVGLTTGTGLVTPADPARPADVAAAAQAEFLASFLAFDAAAFGMLDANLDGVPEEAHPEWAGSLDLLGLQFYASTVILGIPVPPLLGLPCLNITVNAGDPALSDALTNLVADLLIGLG
ncbi:MAG: glycoside hydrolase family 1 protein, partial [Myxococcales bacterium]|nr:glycoside hydrolase family 1 protein [Myxococcales bacterium]